MATCNVVKKDGCTGMSTGPCGADLYICKKCGAAGCNGNNCPNNKFGHVGQCKICGATSVDTKRV